ncbi:putative reverse transcriptase domain, reverse transcriptase zinc-binding domain protein [Tanacetum coccineum]
MLSIGNRHKAANASETRIILVSLAFAALVTIPDGKQPVLIEAFTLFIGITTKPVPIQPQVTTLKEHTSNCHINVPSAGKSAAQSECQAAVTGHSKPLSFASMVKEKMMRKIVKHTKLTNEETVQGAHVAIPLGAVDEEGMERVLEDGPWLIRLVPIILNIWTPNARLKNDEITTVPIWVKLHNVPIVTYSEIRLSLITTHIGKPIMLDGYTSNMCVNSWGRNSYARALIEVSAKSALTDSMVVAIPFKNGLGHSMETINIEYEWKPPRCNTCKIFKHNDNQCPKKEQVANQNKELNQNKILDDEFVEVTRRNGKGKLANKSRQVEGIRLNKPKPNYLYRPVSKTSNVDPNEERVNITYEAAYLQAFNDALLTKECFLKQKAKIEWLYVDDSNMAYLHKCPLREVKFVINFSMEMTSLTTQNGFLFRRFHPRMTGWIMECVTSTSFSISINGSLHGYFKGKKGLRQGDPISHYLFTLVMEVLTLMLRQKFSDSDSFTYHHHCSDLNIINLCFADDLFLFAHGDVNSARVIMEALDEFKYASGLVPSLPKSTAYFCNVLNYVKLDILNVLPFEEGKLPVKYLGVPLVSSRLIYRDCKELVENVKSKINDWKNKFLSFAGRVQLVQSVLASMHIYWASVFMIPSRTLLDLE